MLQMVDIVRKMAEYGASPGRSLDGTTLGFMRNSIPAPRGQKLCGVGNVVGRERQVNSTHFRKTTDSWRGHPSSDPNHGQDDAGYDSEEEERDLHHQDVYMNGGRDRHFGPPHKQEG